MKTIITATAITLATPAVLVVTAIALPFVLIGSALLGGYLAAPHVGRFFRHLFRLVLAGFHATKVVAPIAAKKVVPVAAGLGLAVVGVVATPLVIAGVVARIVGERAGRQVVRGVVAAAPVLASALIAPLCVVLACGGAVLLGLSALLMAPLALLSSVSPVAAGS